MRLKPIVHAIAIVFLVVGALGDEVLQASGWYFGNDDVIGLLKGGKPEDAIKSIIADAQTARFKFERDDLTALKNAGASLSVISAMLSSSRQSSGSNSAHDVMQTFNSLKAETLTLVTQQGQQELKFSRGEVQGGGGVAALFGNARNAKADVLYEGLRADTRTTDQRPSLLVRFESDPTKRYYLVKLQPVVKKKLRSMKLAAAFYSLIAPNEKCKIAYMATQEGQGVWRLTPKVDLEPGEYGLLDGIRLFEFGVDLAEKPSSPPGGAGSLQG